MGCKKHQDGFYTEYTMKYVHVLVDCEFKLTMMDTNMAAWIQGNTIVHLYTIHDLQNFFYSVVRKELTLKNN